MVNIAVTMILPCFLLSCHSSDVHISTQSVSLFKAVYDVHDAVVADTPDADESKIPEAAAADEWDITSPPIEQRPAHASATPTPPEKKKKPRIRSLGDYQLDFYCSV